MMEKILAEGLAKSIGVSNFGVHELEILLASAKVKPVVNQVNKRFIALRAFVANRSVFSCRLSFIPTYMLIAFRLCVSVRRTE
jgi:predicted oxidoreductase